MIHSGEKRPINVNIKVMILGGFLYIEKPVTIRAEGPGIYEEISNDTDINGIVHFALLPPDRGTKLFIVIKGKVIQQLNVYENSADLNLTVYI